MTAYTIRFYHSYGGQSSPFDYEGWAHQREAHWSERRVEGSLGDARREARRLNAKAADGDHIIEEGSSVKHSVEEPA